MRPSIGLKVWSTNTGYTKPAAELFAKGVYEFIELYTVPGSFKETASRWQALNIPMRLHAPHELNIALRDKEAENMKLCAEVNDFAKALKALSVVLHPGEGGDLKTAFLQLPKLKQVLDAKILIENMPYISLSDEVCPGAYFEDIQKITEKCGVGFCFDICHATKAAVYLKRDVKKFVERFASLKPEVIHLSDGHTNTIYDEHLSIGRGQFDFEWIAGVIRLSGCFNLVLEMEKRSKENLDNFAEDAAAVKALFDLQISEQRGRL